MVCPDEIWTGSVANGMCPHDQIADVPQLPVVRDSFNRQTVTGIITFENPFSGILGSTKKQIV
jgi:hypothetical protein